MTSRQRFDADRAAVRTRAAAPVALAALCAALAVACQPRSAQPAAAPAAQPPAAAACGGAIDPANWPQPAWPLPADPALEQRIDALMATMTVEEKVGQTIQGDISTITPGSEPPPARIDPSR